MDSRVLIWDIECTNLDADFGTILCIGYKWLGESKVTILTITDYETFEKDPTNDKQLVKDFLRVYTSADMTVAYNGILFDRPYIMAKVLEYGLEIPPSIPLQDPYFATKSNLRISRKSLAVVGELLGLHEEKTKVLRKIWKRAATGHVPSIRYVVHHCKKDVLVLEEAYMRLRPLMRTHFRLSEDLGHCRFCNSGHLQSRGKNVSKLKGQQKRVWCVDCGGWDTRTLKEVEKFALREAR